ncbi:MAG: exodeoxyribonuclease VII large subunit [Lachnospiraceae bacterium]
MARENRNVYSVGQVNTYIKNLFAQDFLLERIAVKGEVSNCKYHTSGHIYFTLKDATGAIACVMFAGNRKGLAFRMKEGDNVVVNGSIQVYERDGKYQLYAREIRLDGAGALYVRFEQLKQELAEMGMFAPEYKQPIPPFIRTLGIVTAPTGAAIQDIRNIAHRRNPTVQLILYPALVQGEGAAASIVNGIRALEALGVDAMIVGRGGGSIEDLWAFNEEIVARAVFDCSVPVISAVGHETDTTIIDYVADLRAPTPSAAAELAVWQLEETGERIDRLQMSLNRQLQRHLTQARSRMETLAIRLRYLSPENQLNTKRRYALDLEDRLAFQMQRALRETKHRLQLLAQQMETHSPLKKLGEGYSLVTDESGKTVRDFGQIETGMRLTLRMIEGDVITRVEGKQCRKDRVPEH